MKRNFWSKIKNKLIQWQIDLVVRKIDKEIEKDINIQSKELNLLYDNHEYDRMIGERLTREINKEILNSMKQFIK